MNEHADYDRGVASRARQLLRISPGMESREMLKAIIMLFDPSEEGAATVNFPARPIRDAGDKAAG